MPDHEDANAANPPKLQVDSDWKAEAQAEKEKLAAKESEQAAASAGAQGLPEASFKSLVGLLTSQAIMGLGAMVDPETKGVMIDLPGARFAIDLLGVLEEKTKGNLDDEETKELTHLLAELRARYVEITHLVAEQQAAGAVAPAAGGQPGASGLIMPS